MTTFSRCNYCIGNLPKNEIIASEKIDGENSACLSDGMKEQTKLTRCVRTIDPLHSGEGVFAGVKIRSLEIQVCSQTPETFAHIPLLGEPIDYSVLREQGQNKVGTKHACQVF